MLKERWTEWISSNAANISLEQEETLVRAFLDGVTRVTPRWRTFTDAAEAYGITDEANLLRRSLNHSQYALSLFWRAVWVCAAGQDLPWAAQHFHVAEEDLWWALTRLSQEQIAALRTRALFEPWVVEPNRREIERTVLSIMPFCTRYVNKHMAFILRYDQSITATDFVNEIYLFGLAATYRYDATVTDLVHLRNYAWISAKNRAKHLIAHHTRKSRARIQRVVQTEQDSVEVLVSVRASCRRCNKPSDVPLCKPCEVELNDPVAAWNWKRESVNKFLVDRSSKCRVLVKPKPMDTFQSNVVSMSPCHGDDKGQPQWEDKTEQPISAEMANDLSKKPWRVQQVCKIVLGLEMPNDFQIWLNSRNVKQTISEKKLAHEACLFYGISREEVREDIKDLVR